MSADFNLGLYRLLRKVIREASAMTALGKMNRAKTVEVMAVYETAANKLMRTFAAQTEALRKHRNKSTQTIRHVHVNQGGQAIVADTINHAGRGVMKVNESLMQSAHASSRCTARSKRSGTRCNACWASN